MTTITNEDYHNPPDKLHTEDISIMGLTPFAICMHASRQAMSLSQAGQMPPLCNTERAMCYHGVIDVKKIAITTTVPHDSVVLNVVDDIILFKTLDETMLFHIELPKWVGNHSRFGYRPKRMFKDIYVGQSFKKGTILAQPPTLQGDHFNTGTHLNVLVASYPGNAEDGCILSEAAREKLAYDTVSEVVFEIKEGMIPINFWGNDNAHIGIPRVGDIIGPDNTVCVLRAINSLAKPGLLSPKALQKIQVGDKIQQATAIAGGEVMEVTVTSNVHNQHYTYGGYCAQLDTIVDQNTRKQELIVDTAKNYIAANKRKGLITIEDADLVSFVVNARMLAEARRPTDRVKLTHRAKPAASYSVSIKILKRGVTPARGGKLTDRSSAKITVTSIWPTELMPEGVDIIVGPEGATNRTIPSRDIEQWINAAAVIGGDMIRDILGYKRINSSYVVPAKKVPVINSYSIKLKTNAVKQETIIKRLIAKPDLRDACLKIIYKWSSVTNTNMALTLKENSTDIEAISQYISDIVFHNIVTPLPTTYVTEVLPWKICAAIDKSIFKPPRIELTGKNFNGMPIDFKYDHFVGPIYFSVLDKVAQDISASASQMLQVQQLPATRNHKDKYTSTVSRYPSKLLDLDTCQIMACALGGSNKVNHEFLELFDRLISRRTQEAEIETMLNSDAPSGHLTLVDRNRIKYGEGRSLQVLRHLLNTHGVSLVAK